MQISFGIEINLHAVPTASDTMQIVNRKSYEVTYVGRLSSIQTDFFTYSIYEETIDIGHNVK